MALTIRLGLNYRGDISNRVKAVEDLLVDTLDMPDDRYIDRLLVERDQSIEGAVVTVEGSYVGEARPIGDIMEHLDPPPQSAGETLVPHLRQELDDPKVQRLSGDD
ncbi:hypothetical protein AB5I41_01600 [Sphingomonas sp. MMS24-JH45]